MYWTVPETNEPTGTVVMGLMVPVACTAELISPRFSTCVTYRVVLACAFHQYRLAKATETTRLPMITSLVRFDTPVNRPVKFALFWRKRISPFSGVPLPALRAVDCA